MTPSTWIRQQERAAEPALCRESVFHRDIQRQNRLNPGGYLQPAFGRFDVAMHGVTAQAQNLPDLPIGLTERGPIKAVLLAARQELAP